VSTKPAENSRPLADQVAFVTGAARGQGRAHAQTLAAAGADVIGLDLCGQVDSVSYPMATPDDLDETVRLVESLDRRMVALTGDVRERADVEKAVQAGLEAFGRLDIVIANAGIMAFGLKPYPHSQASWRDTLDVNLTGVWNTVQVGARAMVDQGRGGAIVLISSSAGQRPSPTNWDGGFDGYVAAKFGVVGLMRTYAGALAQYGIRVNTVHPTAVATPMVMNEFFGQFAVENGPLLRDARNGLPVEMIESDDISRAVLYLVSESGRYVTGQTLAVDAGVTTIPGASAVFDET
jgi:SDR family mycofactocin-dependent oxidoreductase